MRIFHPMSRMIACAGLALVFATAAFAVVAAAQTQGSCPPIIASLLPKNASIRDGQYMAVPADSADKIGNGSGSADIPFEHQCIKSNKFPARISIKVTYFGGEAVWQLQMGGDAFNEEAMSGAMRELEQRKRTLNNAMSEPKRERLAGGEIVYADFKSECPPKENVMADVGEMIVPNVKLRGVISTDNARLEVKLEGQISVELAKAAVTEVFENLKKADFAKVK